MAGFIRILKLNKTVSVVEEKAGKVSEILLRAGTAVGQFYIQIITVRSQEVKYYIEAEY